MANKPESKKAEPARTFSIGDRVEIAHFGPGRITALRGPLGPGGVPVYRVRYRRKPTAGYLEVLGSQLRLVEGAKRAEPAGDEPPPVADAHGGSNGTVHLPGPHPAS
ncbi:MAG: hypothetical protein ACRC33_20955 [Gemmataceae bacterium]